MTITTLSVPGMSCATCKNAIERALTPADGVAAVEVDLAAKTVAVRHEAATTVDRLIELVEGQGYDVADRCSR